MKKKTKILNKYLKQNFKNTKQILVLLFLFTFFLLNTNFVNGYSVQPVVEDFVIRVNEEENSVIYFTNTTEQTQSFEISSNRYNPEKEEIIEERNFIVLETTSLLLEPGETGEIHYSIKLHDDVLGGSYFSIIVIKNIDEDNSEEKKAPINIDYGIGSLVAIHVVDDTNIFEIFTQEVEVDISYTKPLNPLKTQIEYHIKNNSKYTFLPMGQLSIISVAEKPISYNINTQEQMLYPGNEMKFEFLHEGDIKDFLTNKTVRSLTGMQFSDKLKEKTIELPYLTQTLNYFLAFSTALITLTITFILIKMHRDKDLVKKFRKSFNK